MDAKVIQLADKKVDERLAAEASAGLFFLIGDPKVAPQFGGFYHEFAIAGSARMTQAEESMNLASATSLSLRPPASWVDSTISTLL